MNLISFNIDDKLLDKESYKLIKNKKKYFTITLEIGIKKDI